MTIKELAFSAQQHLQVSTGTQIKRAHIYELMAAAFGFGSYAALCTDAVFTKHSLTNWRSKNYGDHIRRRCIEIGYQADTAVTVKETEFRFNHRHHNLYLALLKLLRDNPL